MGAIVGRGKESVEYVKRHHFNFWVFEPNQGLFQLKRHPCLGGLQSIGQGGFVGDKQPTTTQRPRVAELQYSPALSGGRQHTIFLRH